MDQVVKISNAQSHYFGEVDEVRRCLNCEVAPWNAWKQECVTSIGEN